MPEQRQMITQGAYSILQGQSISLLMEIETQEVVVSQKWMRLKYEYTLATRFYPAITQLLLVLRFLRSGAKSAQLVINEEFPKGACGSYQRSLRNLLTRLEEPGEKLFCRTPGKVKNWQVGSSVVITRKIKRKNS